jgi:hypothetical protein
MLGENEAEAKLGLGKLHIALLASHLTLPGIPMPKGPGSQH